MIAGGYIQTALVQVRLSPHSYSCLGSAKRGVANVKSAVLLRVWDKFHQHGIEIPYPQRDVHLIPPVNHDRDGDKWGEYGPANPLKSSP